MEEVIESYQALKLIITYIIGVFVGWLITFKHYSKQRGKK